MVATAKKSQRKVEGAINVGAKLSSADVPVVENGVVRYTVFPNAIRDLRKKRGFQTLQSFVDAHEVGVNYTRLAKIERGQIFPKAQEVRSLAKALKSPVYKIFIDPTDPEFSREEWAFEHIEASLSFVGGNREDMRLGAAMRIRRRELNVSTTGLDKFKLSAATASRIENADRPFSRWPDDIRASVRRLFGAGSMLDVQKTVNGYDQDGRLGEVMYELFSPASISERNNRSLLALLKALDDRHLADLKDKVEGMLRAGRKITVESGSVNIDRVPVMEQVDVFKSDASIPVFSSVTRNGISQLTPTEELVERQAAGNGLVLRIDSPILGRGLAVNSIVHFEEIDRSAVKDGMIIAIVEDDQARIVSASVMGRGFSLFQDAPAWKGTLATMPGRVARAIKIEPPR